MSTTAVSSNDPGGTVSGDDPGELSTAAVSRDDPGGTVSRDDPGELFTAAVSRDDPGGTVSRDDPGELSTAAVSCDDLDALPTSAVAGNATHLQCSAPLSSDAAAGRSQPVFTLSEVLSYGILPHLPAESPACGLLLQIIEGIQTPSIVSHESSVQIGM